MCYIAKKKSVIDETVINGEEQSLSESILCLSLSAFQVIRYAVFKFTKC